MLQKIETKVYVAVAGAATGGSVITGLILWLLGVLVWHAPNTAAAAGEAVSRVPSPVALAIGTLLAVIGAAIGGYQAPHTDRPSDSGGTEATDQPAPAAAVTSTSPAPAKTDQPALADQSAALAASAPTNDNNGVLSADYDWSAVPVEPDTDAVPAS